MRLLTIVFLAACSSLPPAVTREEVQAVQPLYVNDDFHCTAWYLGDRTWVTAAHCLENPGVLPDIRVGERRVTAWRIPTIPVHDGGQDVALFRSEGPYPPPAVIAHGLPDFGEEVYFVGYPTSPDGVLRFGVYAGRYNGANNDDGWRPDRIMFSTAVDGGASGSPLMHRGRVIGVVVSSYRRTPYAFAEAIVSWTRSPCWKDAGPVCAWGSLD